MKNKKQKQGTSSTWCSQKKIFSPLILFVLVGMAISGYFVYNHYHNNHIATAKTPGHNHKKQSSLQIYLTNLVSITNLKSALQPDGAGFILNHKQFSGLYIATFFNNYKKSQTYILTNLKFSFFFPTPLHGEIYLQYSFQSYNQLKSGVVDINYVFMKKN